MAATPRPRDPADPALRAEFERVTTDQRARDEVILRFRPLAEHWARRFAASTEPPEDLAQVAAVGLIEAVDRFDPRRGVAFSTFASATIAGELKRHLRDRTWRINVPRSLKETVLEVRDAEPRVAQEVGTEPSTREVADAIGIPRNEVIEARDASAAALPGSIDAALGRELEPVASDAVLDVADEWAEAAATIRRLPDRERTVLFLSFFEDRTQSEIGREIGVSQVHVGRLRERALARVRAALAAPARPGRRRRAARTPRAR